MRGFIRGLAWIMAILAAIALLLYLLVFDTWVIPKGDPMFAASIEPNLRVEDRILTRRGQTPTYGQLARCTDPRAATKVVVGRVFGRAGDLVAISGESVTTNGTPNVARHGCPPIVMTHPVTGELVQLACAVEENPAWTYSVLRKFGERVTEGDHSARVESGKMFLVSDNRHIHQDSRDYGQVDESTCEHIVYRLWGDSYVDSSRRNTILW